MVFPRQILVYHKNSGFQEFKCSWEYYIINKNALFDLSKMSIENFNKCCHNKNIKTG